MNLHIFDLDGVLVDTSAIHTASLRQAVLEHVGEAASLESFLDAGDGIKTADKLKKLAALYTFDSAMVDARKIELTKEKLPTLPPCHAKEWLLQMKQQGKQVALASNSRREFVELIIDVVELRGVFNYVLTGSDVKNGKPAPDIFLNVMSKLGVPSWDSVIYEDSPTGLRAAYLSRATVVRVNPTTLLRHSDLK